MKTNKLLLSGLAGGLLLFFALKPKSSSAASTSPAAPSSPSSPSGAYGSNYLNDASQPRGVRNNNPLNLVRTGDSWKGKISHKDSRDTKFEQFISMPYGIRAAIKDIAGDITKDGDNTITKLITKFAPNNENDTDRYIQVITTLTKIPANKLLVPDKETMAKLVMAMAVHENGKPVVTADDFNKAWSIL